MHLPTQAGLITLEAENYVSGLINSLVHRQIWWMSSEFHPHLDHSSVHIVLIVFPTCCFSDLDFWKHIYAPLYPPCANEGGVVSVSVYTQQTPVGNIKY